MEKVPCPQAIASVIARRNVEVLGNRYLLIGSYYKLVQNLDFKYVRSFKNINYYRYDHSVWSKHLRAHPSIVKGTHQFVIELGLHADHMCQNLN